MKQANYFLTAHTSDGLISHARESLIGVDKILIIEHPSVRWTTIILNDLIRRLEVEDFELILSSSGEEYIEGIIFPEASIAVVTDTFAVSYSQWLPEAEKYSVDITRLNVNEKERKEFIEAYSAKLKKAYTLLKDGLDRHESVEEIYIKEINSALADDLAQRLILELLDNVPKRKEAPETKKRFFGTNTPFGTYNIVPSLLNRVRRADLIHGRAGTGKSTLMLKIATAILNHGYPIEVYHCSFDPSSVDMVLAPDLNYCIMDATEPHAFDPKKKGERIIDTYKEFVTPGTDEKYHDEITARTEAYKEKVKQSKNLMQQAGALFSKIEEPFQKNEQVLKEQLEDIVTTVINKIESD